MTRILAVDPIPEPGLALLRKRPEFEIVDARDVNDDALGNHMEEAEIILLRGRNIRPEHFDRARKLRFISRHGVGLDKVDMAQMQRLGVTVAVTADANYLSVAEHAMMLTLAGCRRVISADHATRNGGWRSRIDTPTHELSGSTVLLLGFGRIGQTYAGLLSAFGCRISVYDPYLPEGATLPCGATRVQALSDVLPEQDIVSLHMPLTDQTRNFIGADLLSRFREGAILVNTARGGVVDEAALVGALDQGRPAIYATDVLAKEPPQPDDPLFSRSDVIVTPHSAALTQQGKLRMALGVAQNVLDFVDGKLAPHMIAFTPE
ncbi:NAD(P)-dependent oxidoreductase [Oceaniglobus trochenteri]|uniref:NAD(P)-dependent oxidoreductase n=1 Tax=Oceaniglobus trochenteri TaxID=2763260 RepID=UPI001CFF66E0|nr:NAD(P)-dependent oxidoreductase [Oceaniglobus trochenteri]